MNCEGTPPHKPSVDERLEMVRETTRDLAKRYGAVDFAVHVPREENDVHNGHAHVMMTTGQVTESGHGAVTHLEQENKWLLTEFSR